MKTLDAILSTAVFFFLVISLSLASTECLGQMINTSVPFNSSSNGFYENHGINFGFSLPGGRGPGSRIVGLSPLGIAGGNLNFSQGGANATAPTFGGYSPNAGANFGFGRRNANGGGFSLGFNMAKGSNRQNISTTPSLTTQNGYGGSLNSGSVRPFVTGVVPIVGHGGSPLVPMSREVPYKDNAVTRAIGSGQLNLDAPSAPEARVASGPANFSNEQSSAMSGALSVSAIKAERKRKLEAAQMRTEKIVDQAKQLEDQGKFSEARTKYREALKETDDKATKDRIKALIKASRLKG